MTKTIVNAPRNRIKRSTGDIVFDVINISLIVLITLIMIYPMWYVIIVSFATPEEAVAGQLYFWPKAFTIEAYEKVFAEKKIWIGYGNTIIYTIAHTLYTPAVASGARDAAASRPAHAEPHRKPRAARPSSSCSGLALRPAARAGSWSGRRPE